MARTLVTGNILRSGSIPTTALGGGVVTSSLQIVASLPTGSLSSSAQVNYPDISNIPGGIASSSAQVIAYLPTDTVSSSVQVTAFLPTNTVSSSGQVTAFLPTGTVSSSGQIDITGTTNYSTFSSSLATVDTAQSSRLTTLESVTGSYATTGSNTFVAPQTISDTTNSTSYLDGALHVAGGMSVRQDVRISGSMTINGLLTAVSMSTQYVTSSQYNVGTSRITLNDDDNVRFAGLSIIDSGSSSPTSASILWDSLQHRFIYENLSGSSYNSSIIIAGPKHTGSLGDEPTLTSGYIPVATGTDHIDNSVIFQSGSNIGIGITTPNYKLNIKGDNNTTPLYVEVGSNARYQFSGNSTSGYNTTFNMDDTGLSIGHNSSLRDFRLQTDSTTRIIITGAGNVGIGTTNPQTKLDVRGSIASSYSAATYATFDSSTDGNLYITANAGAANVSVNTIFRSSTAGGAVTERMRIDSSGNVGIGITNPTQKLVISDSSTNGTSVNIVNTSTGGYNWNIFSGGSAETLGPVGSLIFRDSNNGVTRMLINSSGNVGIGTTNPTATLQVVGPNTTGTFIAAQNDGAGGFLGVRVNAGTYPYNHFSFSNGYVGIGTTSPSTTLVVVGGAAAISTSTVSYTIAVQDPTSAAINVGGSILFQGYKTGTASIGNYAYITGKKENGTSGNEAGYLALGTFDSVGNKAEYFRITSAGNVGIGTTNPRGILHIGGDLQNGATDAAAINLKQTSTTAVTGIYLERSGERRGYYIYVGGDLDSLNFQRNNAGTKSDVMTLTRDGNVGIGTANPAARFEIAGTTSTSPQQFITNTDVSVGGKISGLYLYSRAASNGWYSGIDAYVPAGSPGVDRTDLRFYTTAITASEKMRITAGGNVGIGTTNPDDKFQVNGGNLRVSANTTSGTFLDIVPSGTQADGIALSTSFYGGGSYGPLRINTGGSETMRITGGNRVGIGETNPGVKLHVEGVEYNRGNIVRPTVFAGDAQSAGNAIGTYVLGNGKYFNTGGGAKYVHILLPARYNQDNSRMFCVEIKGYDFDRPGILNIMVGGYVTPPGNGGPMSRVATWDATSYYSPTAYYSTNYACGVVRIYLPSTYYVSFVVNSIASGNGDTIAPDEMTMIASTSATI